MMVDNIDEFMEMPHDIGHATAMLDGDATAIRHVGAPASTGQDLPGAAPQKRPAPAATEEQKEEKKLKMEQKKLDRVNALPESIKMDQIASAGDARTDIDAFAEKLLKCSSAAIELSTCVGSMPLQTALRDQLMQLSASMSANYQRIRGLVDDVDEGPVQPNAFLDIISNSVLIVKRFRKLEKQAKPLKHIFSKSKSS